MEMMDELLYLKWRTPDFFHQQYLQMSVSENSGLSPQIIH